MLFHINALLCTYLIEENAKHCNLCVVSILSHSYAGVPFLSVLFIYLLFCSFVIFVLLSSVYIENTEAHTVILTHHTMAQTSFLLDVLFKRERNK